MFQINFNKEPEGFDENGIAIFETTQKKGLRHNQSNILLEISDDLFLSLIDYKLFQWITTKILNISHG